MERCRPAKSLMKSPQWATDKTPLAENRGPQRIVLRYAGRQNACGRSVRRFPQIVRKGPDPRRGGESRAAALGHCEVLPEDRTRLEQMLLEFRRFGYR